MRKIAACLLAGLILVSCVGVYASSAGSDLLVTLDYFQNTWLPGLSAKADERVEQQAQAAYQAALGELDAAHSAYLGGEGGSSARLSDQRFKRGDVGSLSTGSTAMLWAGSAGVNYTGAGAVDVTAGQVLPSGSGLPARHRCMAAEDTTLLLTITSDTAVLSLEGRYTVTPGTGVDYNALADALNAMGLFQGTGTAYGSGYDLEVAPTRIVGLVMFLRLIGEEQAALASTAPDPFADTPDWCERYVAYAYEKGYTKGIGPGMDGRLYFGTNTPISAGEYVSFLLRALGYTDADFDWTNALSRAVEFGVLNSAEQAVLTSSPFLRAQVVYLSYFGLSAPLKDGSGVLLDKAAAQGGVDGALARSVMAGGTVTRLS